MAVVVCVCDDACKLRFGSATRHIVFFYGVKIFTLYSLVTIFWCLPAVKPVGTTLVG